MRKFSLIIILALSMFPISSAFSASLEIHTEQYRIGHDITLILYNPDLNRDSDKTESYSLDLIAFHFGNDVITMGPKGDIDAFDPKPSKLRETGDNTGIFYTVAKIPRTVDGKIVKFGEKIAFEYIDVGAFASVFVGANEEKVFAQPVSPMKQMDQGIESNAIVCKVGLELIFKYNNSPACVKPSTAEKLVERGWTANSNLQS